MKKITNKGCVLLLAHGEKLDGLGKKIAEVTVEFSFDRNDLTQLFLGERGGKIAAYQFATIAKKMVDQYKVDIRKEVEHA